MAGIAALLFCVAAATAQTASWTAPTDGYIYDAATQSIRPVDGFIGSAVLGPAILDGLDWASVAPNRKSALIRHAGSLAWIPDLGSPAQSRQLSQIPVPVQALWASDSGRVVLLTSGNELYWLGDFGAQPSVQARWNLESAARRVNRNSVNWVLLATDVSANRVLLARFGNGVGQLRVASAATAPMTIPFAGTPVAAAFLSGGTAAFVADGISRDVVQILGLDSVPVSGTFLSVDQPSAMATSVDGKRLFIADSATSMVRIFDSGSGALLAELTADEVPASLTAFGPDSFILNAASSDASASQPLLLLDTSVAPKILFIPRGN